jgi:hypothetical protein
MTAFDDDSVKAVEARIARELARLSGPPEPQHRRRSPAHYIRQHLAECAGAGDTLDDQIVPEHFLS